MISEPLRNPLSLFDVKDKVAIITGASGTFGRATALALTSLGGKVVLASGSKAELDEVASEVRHRDLTLRCLSARVAFAVEPVVLVLLARLRDQPRTEVDAEKPFSLVAQIRPPFAVRLSG